jgi:dTDP-4-dehydrorhamnose reductase
MKKVVVLGAQGMAGHVMAEYLDQHPEYEVLGVARSDGNYVSKLLDILNFEQLENYLRDTSPDLVVNCIGILVSQANSNVANAILINSYLPNFLAEAGQRIGFKLIHLSTDCVFSGRDGQYQEDSFRDGDDSYARTKALGEVINTKDLTIRTSIIGPELKLNGTGLMDWFFKQTAKINGYTQAYWSGVTTLELAKAVHEMIQQEITGLYQLCPREKISKYDLLLQMANIWRKQITISAADNYVVDKSLVCKRTDFEYSQPEYEAMLLDMKCWMDSRPDYYSHYKLP